MASEEYRDAIVETFRKTALRTVHIIDDAFPTYLDLANPDHKDKFPEVDLALELYKLFRSNNIPCDIENNISAIDDQIERIRKSDLIVLDYNLALGDTKTSVSVVRRLARSKHFNTVILYTAEPNLDGVWMNLALGLRGGWNADYPVSTDEAKTALNDLEDKGVSIDQPSRKIMEAYTLGKSLSRNATDDFSLYKTFFKENGIDSDLHDGITALLIHREARSILKDDEDSANASPSSVDGSCLPDNPRWLQSGNCFVAIMGKRLEDGKDVSPSRLLDALDDALISWRPNILQIVVSKIQNILEQEAVATDELHLRDPNTQTSLCYFLLSSLTDGSGKKSLESMAAPTHTLIDKLVDSVRHRLITEPTLSEEFSNLLLSEVKRLKIPDTYSNLTERRQSLFSSARQMAGQGGDADPVKAMARLNLFLSTEPFGGILTTGTVFSDGVDSFICMTPACDMVFGRAPNVGQVWASSLHPMRPIVVVSLKLVDISKALKEAEHVKYIFVKNGAEISAFEFLGKEGFPSYEFVFLDNGGEIKKEKEICSFTAVRMTNSPSPGEVDKDKDRPEAVSQRVLATTVFSVVGQLRANYASRFLQETGQWLSRIGVDYVRNVI